MKKFGSDLETRLMLFNIIDPDANHWAAALEIYFEKRLHPKIKAKKLG
ncbi:MAG: hypothetical protein OEZ58_13105 [Gammaproteobacteria bacterium]|nr:hypothetical protein [Gammaproteobacteria bacterium]